MRIPRIFLDQDIEVGKVVELDDFASGHICRVLRMKAGRPLIVFNGRGGEYQAELKTPHNKKAEIDILSFEDVNRESPLSIHLGLALSKGDRFDWALQKSVELGVTNITPLLSVRSDRLGEPKRQERKDLHWRRLIISACEQAGRTEVPKISAPQASDIWMQAETSCPGFILQPNAPSAVEEIKKLSESTGHLRIAIGPEGGFDEAEVDAFVKAGFTPISFGPRIMRTETAPVAVISVLQYLLGDLA